MTKTFKQKAFKPALDFSNRSSNQIFFRLRAQQEALTIIRGSIPENLAVNLSCCVIDHKKITLYCESATWATQLRFHHPLLKQVIREKLDPTIESIQIKVYLAPKNKGEAKARIQKKLAPETIAGINNSALSTNDEPLRSALLRLTNALKKINASGRR